MIIIITKTQKSRFRQKIILKQAVYFAFPLRTSHFILRTFFTFPHTMTSLYRQYQQIHPSQQCAVNTLHFYSQPVSPPSILPVRHVEWEDFSVHAISKDRLRMKCIKHINAFYESIVCIKGHISRSGLDTRVFQYFAKRHSCPFRNGRPAFFTGMASDLCPGWETL